jgi:hypothetical protein
MAIAVVLLLAPWRFSSLPALKLIVGRLTTTATAANAVLSWRIYMLKRKKM